MNDVAGDEEVAPGDDVDVARPAAPDASRDGVELRRPLPGPIAVADGMDDETVVSYDVDVVGRANPDAFELVIEERGPAIGVGALEYPDAVAGRMEDAAEAADGVDVVGPAAADVRQADPRRQR